MRNLAGALALIAVLFESPALANPPVEAFGNLPLLASAHLSPDGTQFAVIKPLDGRPVAVIYPVTGNPNSKTKLYRDPEWNVVATRWANDDRLLIIVKGQTKDLGTVVTYHRAISLSTKGEETALLFHGKFSLWANFSTATITDLDIDDPGHIFMPFGSLMSGSNADLYRVDVNTGDAERVENGWYNTYDWMMDGHGNVLGKLIVTGKEHDQHVVAKLDDWTDIAAFKLDPNNLAISNLGVTEDGKGFVFRGRNASGQGGLMRLNLAKGATPEELYLDPQYDDVDTLTDEWTGRAIGAVILREKPEYHYFDAVRQSLQDSIEAAFPGLIAHAVSFNRAGDRAIVVTEGPRSPPTYYFLHLAGGRKYRIGSTYPDLSPTDLGEEKPYPYAARDGLTIPAYLTLPPGKPAKNLPAIVMPHGGPDARDTLGFDWWAQFLANRGYAVLQPNYRGSTGYGAAFNAAGFHQWGLKMQDDISDGVKRMIADGIADPKRICIVGASYGGYAALAGATLTPGLYACAVSVAGVSNLKELVVRAVPWGTARDHPFMTLRLGLLHGDSDRLAATSLVLHADQVRCPILLLHGKNDTTVPIKQSEMMRDALTKAGKRFRFVTFDRDDHYLTVAATRIQMLTEIEAFLKENIGN